MRKPEEHSENSEAHKCLTPNRGSCFNRPALTAYLAGVRTRPQSTSRKKKRDRMESCEQPSHPIREFKTRNWSPTCGYGLETRGAVLEFRFWEDLRSSSSRCASREREAVWGPPTPSEQVSLHKSDARSGVKNCTHSRIVEVLENTSMRFEELLMGR